MRIEALLAITLAITLGLAGCNTYKFGDVSRAYCRSTSVENREVLRNLADDAGLSITDYCASFGVAFEVLEDVRDVVEVDVAPK